MIDMLILAEKASAAKHMAKAFGGTTGNVGGKTYKIVHAHGHLMEFKEPEKMVATEADKQRYSSWTDMQTMPWNQADFSWAKTYTKAYNAYTKKSKSTRADVAAIKAEAANAQAILIATDNDPSGEGDLLGWEIVNAIKWQKPVYRIRFADETPKSLNKAMQQMVEITDQFKQGEYLKSDARSKWDFLSMQLTRISTYAARQAGYRVKVINQGRLKSVIVLKIWQQQQLIDNYIKTPYFEAKFKDPAGHIFARKLKDDAQKQAARFADETSGQADVAQYTKSPVTNIKREHKTQAPGALLDLAKLGSLLAQQGFNSKEVLATYQKMYEAEIVSYPRTEDRKITQEQYNELLPVVDTIATVVGVDPQLLTHRVLRSKHRASSAAHGANRPGIKVPKSMAELAKYGPSAQAIYKTLAANYLAILGEDYEFDRITAELQLYPDFKTGFNVPVKLNYRAIFDDTEQVATEVKSPSAVVGPDAAPFMYQGANPKPTRPSADWIGKFLEKHNIGTGATRLSVQAQLISGKNAFINEKRGFYTLTQPGTIAAVLVRNTWIGSPSITKQLFDHMDAVGKLNEAPAVVIDSATKVIAHDLPLILNNSQKLAQFVGKQSAARTTKKYKPKPKAQGQYQDGSTVEFNSTWSGHKFSAEEIRSLLHGDVISFNATSKYGKTYTATGSLKQQTFKGKKFWGFKADFGK
ncbi:DNA topoisomerase [Loigolactobacillus zhaoyuanensis]|uniref:DNA topoisomerase n=1 Tax=Loigolactobacillus zhaoyuanensis TaxID=2486017 RepID=UPI000F746872|nr:DNA topoisomerase [Loigolactobacillus zhaoyuanensis]